MVFIYSIVYYAQDYVYVGVAIQFHYSIAEPSNNFARMIRKSQIQQDLSYMAQRCSHHAP